MNENKTEEKIVVQKPPKSPALAGILAFFFPGVGHLYNRQIVKGLIFIFIFAGLVSMQPTGGAQPFIALVLAGFYIFQLVDAIQTSKAINHRFYRGEEEEEEKLEEFPESVRSGSVFWGLILLVLGSVLLLANYDVISYEKLIELWPIVIIVIGIKLVVDHVSKK
ncbi:hypothetical protein KGY73_00650 [bacterium]|nr:hypothetical protein [bacterium]